MGLNLSKEIDTVSKQARRIFSKINDRLDGRHDES